MCGGVSIGMVALKTHVEDPDVGTRFVVWIGRHTPGAEAPFFNRVERPKVKALGYPEAKCKDNSRSPFGDDNKKNESSGKGKGGTADSSAALEQQILRCAAE
jgi:hypothetical protein